jgi:hypothetical protein
VCASITDHPYDGAGDRDGHGEDRGPCARALVIHNRIRCEDADAVATRALPPLRAFLRVTPLAARAAGVSRVFIVHFQVDSAGAARLAAIPLLRLVRYRLMSTGVLTT